MCVQRNVRLLAVEFFSTIVFPVPIDMLHALIEALGQENPSQQRESNSFTRHRCFFNAILTSIEETLTVNLLIKETFQIIVVETIFQTGVQKQMGITVGWDNQELNTIRYEFDREWTWADLIAATKADDEIVAGHEHFNLILDVRNVGSVPALPTVKPHQLAGEIGAGGQLGLIVLVGRNRWAEAILQMVYRMYGNHASGIGGIEMVETLEEARALIEEYEAAQR